MIEPATGRGSAATRYALIEAAARSLAERGYAGTTTATICSRAGVTSGAMFGHFPTKVELLAQTAEFLSEHGRSVVEEAVNALDLASEDFGPANLERRCSLVVEALAKAYREPEMQAVLELAIVARTSPELAAALAGRCPSEQDLFVEVFVQVVPELDSVPMGRAGLALVVDAMRMRSVRDAAPDVIDLRDGSTSVHLGEKDAVALLARLAAG